MTNQSKDGFVVGRALLSIQQDTLNN